MENGTFGDQEGNTLHGLRDVEKTAEFYHWSELARAPQKELETTGRYSHIGASNVGLESSTLLLPTNGHPNSPEDGCSSSEEERRIEDKAVRVRSKKSMLDEIPSSMTPPNWEDYPEPAPQKSTIPHIDANVRVVAQYAEEKSSNPQAAEKRRCHAS